MTARFGAFVLLASVAVVLCGCADCPEEVQETVSPDGGTTVRVLLDYGCGGATVGSSTHIFLVNNRAIWFLRRPHGIAGIDGYPKVKPIWNSDKLLTMEVTLHKETDEFEWRKTEAHGVTIRWVVTEGKGDWDKRFEEIILP